MTITYGYCTLSELRAEVGITSESDTTDDSKLELAIDAVSRWIDDFTGWRFYTTSADETRYYTASCTSRLEIPLGLLTLTSLATDEDGDRTYETTWAATDYDLLPYNAALESEPYRTIGLAPLGRYGFPLWAKGVKLVGKFGYASSAPKAIKRACLLRAQQIFKRKDAPFGVEGAGAFGQILMRVPPDADVAALLLPYRRML